MNRHLRVLSYNIHKGFNTGNRKFILGKIRDAIRSVQPDLIFLQEVQGHHVERMSKPQFEFLAHKIWPHFSYGKNAVYESGHHGNAILSKYPFVFSENIDISTNRFEKRGLLHGMIKIPGCVNEVHAICVHLGLLEPERQKQIGLLCQRIESHVPHEAPLVIAGDFNDWRDRATTPLKRKLDIHEAFLSVRGRLPRTYPSWLPSFRLDRIYFRGMTALSAECLAVSPWNHLSDHAALTAKLKF